MCLHEIFKKYLRRYLGREKEKVKWECIINSGWHHTFGEKSTNDL